MDERVRERRVAIFSNLLILKLGLGIFNSKKNASSPWFDFGRLLDCNAILGHNFSD